MNATWGDSTDDAQLSGERRPAAEAPFYGCRMLAGAFSLDLEYRREAVATDRTTPAAETTRLN